MLPFVKWLDILVMRAWITAMIFVFTVRYVLQKNTLIRNTVCVCMNSLNEFPKLFVLFIALSALNITNAWQTL